MKYRLSDLEWFLFFDNFGVMLSICIRAYLLIFSFNHEHELGKGIFFFFSHQNGGILENFLLVMKNAVPTDNIYSEDLCLE